jgi:hypothetical protein
VVFVRLDRRDKHEEVLREAMRRSDMVLGKPAEILFVIQKESECPQR